MILRPAKTHLKMGCLLCHLLQIMLAVTGSALESPQARGSKSWSQGHSDRIAACMCLAHPPSADGSACQGLTLHTESCGEHYRMEEETRPIQGHPRSGVSRPVLLVPSSRKESLVRDLFKGAVANRTPVLTDRVPVVPCHFYHLGL